MDGDTFRFQQFLPAGDAGIFLIPENSQHPLHRPGQVDGGGAGGAQKGALCLQRRAEDGRILRFFPKGKDIHGIAGKDADGRSTAHGQGPDCPAKIFNPVQRQPHLRVRQTGLIQDLHAAPIVRKVNAAPFSVQFCDDHGRILPFGNPLDLSKDIIS